MSDAPYTPTDRRPLKSREQGVWKRCAAGLAKAGVSANSISVWGMLAGVAAGVVFSQTATAEAGGVGWRALWLAGAALVQVRLLCNMLDGMVALARGTASPVGELYNEIPDRVSDVATLVGLGYAAGSSPTLGWGAAVLAVFIAYLRAVGKGGGVAMAFHGPMAKPHRMFAVTLAALIVAVLPPAWTVPTEAPSTFAVWTWGVPRLALAVIIVGGLVTVERRLVFIASGLKSKASDASTEENRGDA